jgi:anthranilate phosphoribosyltransferase
MSDAGNQSSELNSAAGWQRLADRLVAGESLSRADSAWFAESVYSGEAPADAVASVLVRLHDKGESADEIAGILEVLLARTTPVTVAGEHIDIVGTGGDGHHSVNISTMAAIVCAAAGVPVVKHGNRAATSMTGSADVLEALGIAIDLPAAAVEECVRDAGIGFCFAPVFHSSMRHAAAVRKSLPHPTVFNLIGPLANPSQPTTMLVGCADHMRAPLMAQVLAERGAYALVVRGLDGLDEVSTAAATQVWAPSGITYEVHAGDFDIAPAQPGALAGGDANFNAEVLRQVLAPSASTAAMPGVQIDAIRDCVVMNAAMALVAVERAGDTREDCNEALARNIARARSVLADGGASAVLDCWVHESRRCQTIGLT